MEEFPSNYVRNCNVSERHWKDKAVNVRKVTQIMDERDFLSEREKVSNKIVRFT